jgi:hypothetical protein
MKLLKLVFHLLSYLQYPAMVMALYYPLMPLLAGKELQWTDLNNSLVFVGLGISLATLQDPARSQNKLFSYIKDHPEDGKRIILLIVAITALILVLGIVGFFSDHTNTLNELYFGFFLFGVGLIGFLQRALDSLEGSTPGL